MKWKGYIKEIKGIFKMKKVNRATLIEMIKNNEDVTDVDTSEITDMSKLFYKHKEFNQDISKWDVSSVEDMYIKYYGER
jgi:surface protein